MKLKYGSSSFRFVFFNDFVMSSYAQVILSELPFKSGFRRIFSCLSIVSELNIGMIMNILLSVIF